MEQLLKDLLISSTGKYVNDNYVIDIDSYDEFSSIYNKLEQSEIIKKDSDESYFNMDEAHIVYVADNYILNLNGDLNADEYQMIIEEL